MRDANISSSVIQSSLMRISLPFITITNCVSLWKRKYSSHTLYFFAYPFFSFSQFMDFLSTYIGLAHFSTIFYETNPFMDIFITSFGYAAHGITKVVILPILLVLIMEKLLKRYDTSTKHIRLVASIVIVFGSLTLFIALKNFYLIITEGIFV